MKDLVRNTYDKIAEKYAQSRSAFDNDTYLERFASYVTTHGTILDIGCGSGVPVDRFLVSKGFNVIGLDLSPKQIELARRNVPQASYEVRDISDLKPSEYTVDAIVSFYALFHIPRETHADVFRTLATFLPVGGPILVTMASTDWEGVSEDFYGEPMYESHYDPVRNAEIIRSAGFQIIFDEFDTQGGEKHQVILAKKAGT